MQVEKSDKEESDASVEARNRETDAFNIKKENDFESRVQLTKFEGKVKTFSNMKNLEILFTHMDTLCEKKNLKVVFYHNAKSAEERRWNGIQETLAAEWGPKGEGETTQESKEYGKFTCKI